MSVSLTSFRGAERGGTKAAVSHAGFPGETAASTPDAADPRPGVHTRFLRREGPTAGGSVNEHVVEQHAGEAPEHIHGPARKPASRRSTRGDVD